MENNEKNQKSTNVVNRNNAINNVFRNVIKKYRTSNNNGNIRNYDNTTSEYANK